MKRLILYTYCFFFSAITFAQIKIAANTAMSGGQEAIITSSISIDNESALVNLPILRLENSSTITTTEDMTIAAGLQLFSGRIEFIGSGKVLYNGLADGILYDENNYLINGFYAFGNGLKTYPVGTPTQLADAQMQVTGDPGLISTVKAYNQDVSLNISVPAGIDAVSNNWYWEFVTIGEYTNVTPTLSVQNEDNFLLSNSTGKSALVVLETNSSKDVINKLGRAGSSNAEYVKASVPGFGPYFFLGISKDVKLVINQIITPNNDGVNDQLEVENLDVFAGSYEILLLDRYGGIVWRNTQLHEQDIDFGFLEPGNYICIINYAAGEQAKQMITVLK